jgi:methionine aminopeptidase
MSASDPEVRLRQLATRRAENLRERGAIAKETADAVRAARKAGMTVTRIAEVAELSRQRVHRMLRDE